MWRIRAWPALALVSVVALASPAGTAGRATVRLPAPISIDAGARRFQIERDGQVRSLPPRALPFPRDAAWFPGTGVWFAIRHRHLIVGRWRATLWRSTGQYRAALHIGAVTIGHHAVVFSYRTGGTEWLYVSSLDGHERPVARNEEPVGWTSGGFYAYRYRGRQLLLRSDSGALEQTVLRAPPSYVYDDATESLYSIARGDLMRSHGARTEAVASLARLGLPVKKPSVELVPVGRLLELLTNQRLIMLRLDGSLFAETRLPTPDGALAGDVALAPDGHAVAFPSPASQRRRAVGIETVYLLRAGAHAASALHDEHANLGGCVIGASLQWQGRWLLYSATGGYLAVIDSTGRAPAIELTSIAERLSRPSAAVSAYWSGQPPGL